MGRTIKSAISKLRTERAKIAKARDALREMLSEIEDLDSDATEAVESLDYAIDALSRLQ